MSARNMLIKVSYFMMRYDEHDEKTHHGKYA
jgi:hypothetical protein